MSSTPRAASAVCMLALGGCGLVLEAGPPRPDAATSTLDARTSMDAQALDASDASGSLDAHEELDTGSNLDVDAALPPIDAARPDAALARLDAAIDARPTSFIDAVAVPRDAPDADAPDADAGDALDADAGDADADAGDADADARAATDAGGMRPDAFCTELGACRLLSPLCGCTAAQTCQYDPVSFVPTCVAPGATPDGELCDSELDCARGLTCMYLGDPPGICRPFCDATHPCPGESVCLALADASGTPLPAGACSPLCNPIGGIGCPATLACDVATDPQPLTYCRVAGTRPTGGSCTRPTDCPARATCVMGACRALCPAIGAMCAAGRTCTPFPMPVTISGVELGYCPG